MRNIRFFLLFVLLFSAPASACMWDYDTLRDEQRGLPGVFEILTGRYEQRSAFFYADRITKMQALLATDPNNQPAIDNLAVALFRIGRTDEAIAAMQDKENRFPDQYTTSSNLATFYMLSGNNAAAILLLEKALRINPDAHFGREKYQLQLAQYLAAPTTQPATRTADFLGNDPFDWHFPSTMDVERNDDGTLRPAISFIYRNRSGHTDFSPEQQAALNGVLGMIRFGTDQSPDLFYALGNLLLLRGDRNLAVRAYARAIDLHHPLSADIAQLQRQVGNSISPSGPTADEMKNEQAAGVAWTTRYEAFTDDLIRTGKNPEDDANFAEFYSSAGPPVPKLWWSWRDLPRWDSEGAAPFYIFASIPFVAVILRVLRKLGITSPRAKRSAA